MSRSGYTDDVEDNWQLIRWRGQVASAIRSKRGQSLLRELVEALDAMPEKRLIGDSLVVASPPSPLVHWLFADCKQPYGWGDVVEWGFAHECGVCALGAIGVKRGLDLEMLDPEDYDTVAGVFGVAPPLVQEIAFMNDEVGSHGTPEERWKMMRKWATSHLRTP